MDEVEEAVFGDFVPIEAIEVQKMKGVSAYGIIDYICTVQCQWDRTSVYSVAWE